MKIGIKTLLRRSEDDGITLDNPNTRKYCDYTEILSTYRIENEEENEEQIWLVAFLSDN